MGFSQIQKYWLWLAGSGNQSKPLKNQQTQTANNKAEVRGRQIALAGYFVLLALQMAAYFITHVTALLAMAFETLASISIETFRAAIPKFWQSSASSDEMTVRDAANLDSGYVPDMLRHSRLFMIRFCFPNSQRKSGKADSPDYSRSGCQTS